VFSATSTFPDRERHAPPGGERGETENGNPGHGETGRGGTGNGGARRGREDGFTLIELIVVMALTTVVLGAMLTLLFNSQQIQAGDAEWAQVMQEGRTGMSRMTRELRQASKLEKAEANAVVFHATIGGKAWEVKYECGIAQTASLTTCARYAAEEGKGLPSQGVTILRDVVKGTEVFCYAQGAHECVHAPSATELAKVTAVTLRIALPASGTLKQADYRADEHKTVVLENAAFIRNLDLEG
jgi:prepilin-type N-terminal cleavage/methylation domain-containing protein